MSSGDIGLEMGDLNANKRIGGWRFIT